MAHAALPGRTRRYCHISDAASHGGGQSSSLCSVQSNPSCGEHSLLFVVRALHPCSHASLSLSPADADDGEVAAGLAAAAVANTAVAAAGQAIAGVQCAGSVGVQLNSDGKPQRRCGNCHQLGHNARTCTAPRGGQAAVPAGGVAGAAAGGTAVAAQPAAPRGSARAAAGDVRAARGRHSRRLRPVALDDELLQIPYVPQAGVRCVLLHVVAHGIVFTPLSLHRRTQSR